MSNMCVRFLFNHAVSIEAESNIILVHHNTDVTKWHEIQITAIGLYSLL
jgi:hypothetical protein